MEKGPADGQHFFVAQIPASASDPIPEPRRGFTRSGHRFCPGERLPPAEQEGGGSTAEEPFRRGSEGR